MILCYVLNLGINGTKLPKRNRKPVGFSEEPALGLKPDISQICVQSVFFEGLLSRLSWIIARFIITSSYILSSNSG